MTYGRQRGVIQHLRESHDLTARDHPPCTRPHISNMKLRCLEPASLACGSPRSNGGARLCELQSFDLELIGRPRNDFLC